MKHKRGVGYIFCISYFRAACKKACVWVDRNAYSALWNDMNYLLRRLLRAPTVKLEGQSNSESLRDSAAAYT